MRKEGDKDLDLDRVIAAVAGGDRVDWGGETSRRPDLRPLLEELRVMESVAAAHQRVPDELAGQELTQWGPLRLLERIGRGGFGDVYRAFDPRLEREVALKLIRPGSGREARILQEARRIARVRHSNVLTVYGADRHQGRTGLWTDLIDGRTLEDLLAANGPLGAEEAMRIGLDLCRALAAVHAAGLVHRDVKTLNVMRERGGRTVLMDFGAGAERGPNGLADLSEDGTPLTMAPEELRGEPAAPASDLYSLGVLLYRLVTGHFPVEARSYEELRAHHDRGEHVRLRDRRPDLPVSFVRTVERALEASTERRFRSAGEFERSLMGSGRVSIAAPSHSPRPGRARWTTGWIAASGALIAIISLAIVRPWERGEPPGSVRAVSGSAVRSGTEGEKAPDPALPQAGEGVSDAGRSPPREGPSLVGTPRAAVPLVASAALLCERGDREQALGPGDRVALGDALFLKFQMGEPVHVYVLNEDAAGAVFVLFPTPETDLDNPLAAGLVHRLPGTRAGRDLSWRVTSTGGSETIILIASREPAASLQREIARLPRASLDRPVARGRADDGAPSTPRGIGGMAEGAPSEGNASRPRLTQVMRRLSTGGDAPWIWQIELKNP